MKKKRVLLTLAVLTACTAPFGAAAEEAADPDHMFMLDPMVVTASRYDKKDMDVAATTSVYSHKQLEGTGATTVEGALRYATGIVYKSETIGSTGGEFLIRGKRRGTLVMVDGVPLNFRTGYYNLDNISLNDVERIEVVRGGGAVLYGSDTTGGVINIITKDKKRNQVTASFGNFGLQKHSATVQAGKLGLGFAYERQGSKSKITLPSTASNIYSSKYFNFHGGNKEIVSASYKFDDAFRLTADYSKHKYHRSYNYAYKDADAIYDYRDINDEEYKFVLNFKKAGWKANAFYHRNKSKTDYTYWEYESWPSANLIGQLDRIYRSNYTDKVIGFDLQKEWDLKKNRVLVGFNIYRESYENNEKDKPSWNSKTGRFKSYGAPAHKDYARNVSSVFASLEHEFNDRHSATVSARETWTSGSPDGTEFNEFTPQIQYVYKMNENTSAYASVSKSFTLPTMADMYGKASTLANSGIRPEIGWHYEAGIKHISGGHQWKFAFFKSRVKDFIRLQTVGDESIAMNEDTKNMGVELSCDIVGNNGWSGSWGVSLGNPKFYDARYPEDGWQRSYGRVQLTGSISYQKDKWNASLNGSFLYDRVLESYQEKVQPLFMTGFHASYKPEKNHEIYLNVDNLLNRKDIISHVSSRYLALPTNFELGYRFTF